MMGVQYMQAEGLYSQLLQVGNLVHIGQHEACHSWKHTGGDQGGGGAAALHAAATGHGGAGATAGYFKTLLEDDELASISSDQHHHHPHPHHHQSYNMQLYAAEDTKPLIMRSLEIHGAARNVPAVQKLMQPMITANTINITASAINTTGNSAKLAAHNAISPLIEPTKPSTSSILSPLKRAREAYTHKEGGAAVGKREKKGGEELAGKEKKKKAAAATTTTTAAPSPSPSPSPSPATPSRPAPAAAALTGGRKAATLKPKTPKPAPAVVPPEQPPPPPPPRTDYVHVRARRGQATDSHSLAERVRREKISERMRFLQDLVPGCSKITGKALILDEIINYVQSLQNQVEFLAMRLATTNPKVEHANLRDCVDDEIASPFVEEVMDCTAMLPKALTTHTTNSDLHFDSLPSFYSGLFDDSNFNSSIVSDLSTSTCNDSHLTSMDFSHLG